MHMKKLLILLFLMRILAVSTFAQMPIPSVTNTPVSNIPEIQPKPVNLILEGDAQSNHEVSCGDPLYYGLDQVATCVTHRGKALRILRTLPAEFSTAAHVWVLCDDATRYWTFNTGPRQVLYDDQDKKILLDNVNKNFHEGDEKGSSYVNLYVSPHGKFVAKFTSFYEDRANTLVYLLPSLLKAADLFNYDRWFFADERYLRGMTKDPEANGSKEVVFSLAHPGKPRFGAKLLGLMKDLDFSRLVYVQDLGQFFGSLVDGETALYDPEALIPVRKFPGVRGESFYANDSGSLLAALDHRSLTLVNPKTGNAKSYILGGENSEWLFETTMGSTFDGDPFFPASRMKLIRRINLCTLQTEVISEGDTVTFNGKAMFTASRFHQVDSWPRSVFSAPEEKGLWVEFVSRYSEKWIYVYFDEELEPRKVTVHDKNPDWGHSWIYVPSAGGYYLRDRSMKIFKADFPAKNAVR